MTCIRSMEDSVSIPLLHDEDQATNRSLINLCALDMTSECFQLLIWLFALSELPSIALGACCMMSICNFISTYVIQQKLAHAYLARDPTIFISILNTISGAILSVGSLLCVVKKREVGIVSPAYLLFLVVCQVIFIVEKVRFIPSPTLTYEFVELYKQQNRSACYFTLTMWIGSVMDKYGNPPEPCLPICMILYGCYQLTIAQK